MNVHVVWKRPGEEPVPYEIGADDPADLQKLIGGYFEAIRLAPDTVMWIDEEGRLKPDMAPNVQDPMGRVILGPVVVAKHNGGGESEDMPPLEVAHWMTWLREHAL